jgi:hypothetical protein
MSELTSCNYCNLERIKRDAWAKKQKVTVLADARWGMGGCNVYVHPKTVKIHKLEGGEDGPRKKYFVAWMMQITTHCAC